VHVGTHNLTQSNPLPLEALAIRYPQVKFVQLHCWPFLEEAGWLAKYRPNVYLDTCWQPILNPAYYQQAMRQWLNYVPTRKLMCSQDATSVEMAAGSALFVRELLAVELERASRKLGMERGDLITIAKASLNDNAAAIYGLAK
jgi:predicted TIM-barrel fold metal-dependent hydrolase